MSKSSQKKGRSKGKPQAAGKKPAATTRSSSSPAASSSRTRARRQERKQQRQQQRRMMFAGAVVVLAVVAAIVFFLVNQPADAPIPEGVFDRYDGIPRSTTEAGFPVLGNPAAPVRVEEYSSFSCPSCKDFHASAMETLVEFVRDGVISLTFIPSDSIGPVPNAEGAARAALCAGEQGHFFEFHDALFDWQDRYGNRAFSQNRLKSGIENLGINTGQHDSCVNSSRIDDVINASTDAFRNNGIAATPTIIVNGFEVEAVTGSVVEAIQEALAASGITPIPLDQLEGEPTDVPTEEPEMTPEVTEEASTEMEEPEVTEEAPVEEDSEVTPEATEES